VSTILKALRRLEQEKAAAEEPRPLREQIASAPYSGRREVVSRGWLAAVIALALGVGAGGGAIWWLFGGAWTGTDPVAAAPVAPPPMASAAVPSAQPPLEQPTPEPEPGPPAQAFESDVEIVNRPEALPRLADAEPVAPSETLRKPGSRRPVESSMAAARARKAAIAERATAENARLQPPPVVAIAAPPEALAAEAAPSPPAPIAPAPEPAISTPIPAPVVPTRASAPVARKPAPPVAAARPAPLPSEPTPSAARTAAAPPPEAGALEVEKTQWHPLADRRIAWLRVPGEREPRRVVEGDVIEGMLVAKIEPSGVVFEHNGEQLHRALGKR